MMPKMNSIHVWFNHLLYALFALTYIISNVVNAVLLLIAVGLGLCCVSIITIIAVVFRRTLFCYKKKQNVIKHETDLAAQISHVSPTMTYNTSHDIHIQYDTGLVMLCRNIITQLYILVYIYRSY